MYSFPPAPLSEEARQKRGYAEETFEATEEVIDELKARGLPYPEFAWTCWKCDGTVFRIGNYCRCPSCGTLSTPGGRQFKNGLDAASRDWGGFCDSAKDLLRSEKEKWLKDQVHWIVKEQVKMGLLICPAPTKK